MVSSYLYVVFRRSEYHSRDQYVSLNVVKKSLGQFRYTRWSWKRTAPWQLPLPAVCKCSANIFTRKISVLCASSPAIIHAVPQC